MAEYSSVYMCDFCKASAASIEDVQHAEGCPEPKMLLLGEELASLHIENARLRAENEGLWKFVESRQCDCHDEYDKGPQQCDRCYLLSWRQ